MGRSTRPAGVGARRIAAGSPQHRPFERYDWTFAATLIKRGPVERDALSGEKAGEAELGQAGEKIWAHSLTVMSSIEPKKKQIFG